MTQGDWELAVYKGALQDILKLIQDWRNGQGEELDDFDFLYQIEGLVDEVGLE